MKSLKIKKFLKIFSVIICSIFIFSNNVNAKTVYNIDYSTIDNIINNDNEIKENIDSIYNYIDTVKNDYYIFATYNHDSEYYRSFNLYLLDKSTNITNFYYNLNKDKVLWMTIDFKNTKIYEFSYSNVKYKNVSFDEAFNEFKNNVQNDIGTNTYNIQKSSSMPINNYDKFLLLLYTNIPNGHMATTSETDSWNVYYDLSINDELIIGDKEITSYYDYLNDKEKEVKFRMQFNNDVSPNLKQIVFDFPIAALNNDNTVNARIEFGNWSNIIEEIPIFNSIKIYGYDINQNEIKLNQWIEYDYNTTDYLTSKQIDFKFSLINQPSEEYEIPKEILRVKVYFEFETFNNNYYFNVFDSFIDGTTTWNYIENFLVDYKKYEFKENYDIAIIRSKNYKNIESFYISDKIYFTSPEYNFNLKIYDFNNKLEKYNFTSLTQYLINDVYLKIPLEIDEENNIFPILTKSKENESGTFYLKNDLFVQWYDSETGNILIENESEENFNNNNDLNISNEDKENIKPVEEDSQNSIYVFFNNFWKMFEKFGDNFTYITSCFSAWYFQLPETIQFFLCISFAFIIYKMLASFIL